MSRRRRPFKEVSTDERRRSSGMRSIDYHRYQLKLADRQQRWFANVYLLDEARRRSYMAQSFSNMPLTQGAAAMIGRKFRFRTVPPPEKVPWVEHVKDGRPLTAHGAQLLGVAFEEA